MQLVTLLLIHTTMNMIQSSYFPLSNFPALHLTRLLTDYQELPPNSWSSSTSDEAEAEQQRHTIHDERRQRRMISNRESARRSRMRKQRHLDELWSQVVRLRSENHSLIEKLNQMCESHDRVVGENVRLKEEAAHLRTDLTHLLLNNSFSIFTELPCTAHLHLDDSSDQSAEN